MRTYISLMFTIAVAALAQECRLTQLSPAQPELKIEEGEKSTESQTFRTSLLTLSPSGQIYFFDSVNRIRRIEADGRLVTVAGNGARAEFAMEGPARTTPLAALGQLAFSRAGELHFAVQGRVFRLRNDQIEAVAGSGRPGFNGESGPATKMNLGGIVTIAFSPSDELLILDGFARVRRLNSAGTLETIAGSSRVASANGLTGDEGPATRAALSSPRQLLVLADGTLWIRDLTGRHLREIKPNGIIDTLNTNFDTGITLYLFPDGRPAGATANRILPLRPDGNFDTAAGPPYPPFTGTPLAVARNGALYFLGNARPDQTNPLIKLENRVQSVVAGAPVPQTVDGQASPLGLLNPKTGGLLYSAAQADKFGILEVRPGQPPRFVVGGGTESNQVVGKTATDIALYGIISFTVDDDGRITLADTFRRRLLVADASGKMDVLKNSAGEEIVYAPLGSFGSIRRLATDRAGNIYWVSQNGALTGQASNAEITVWNRASGALSVLNVQGLFALGRLEDGSVGAIAGNGANFRSLYPIENGTLGQAVAGLRMLPLVATSRLQNKPYFVAASRLFRGNIGEIEWLDLGFNAAFTPDMLVPSSNQVLLHQSNGGFYRLDNPDACNWVKQPLLATGGVTNSASFKEVDRVAPRQLLTIFGTGFGPAEGQEAILDGNLRASGQAAPYPALTLGNFSGTIPFSALTGTTLPVLFANDKQVTVQATTTVPASGQLLLYYTWQGLQLFYPTTLQTSTAAPGLFTAEGSDGPVVGLLADGTRLSPANPAAPGSVVQLFGTGFGAIDVNLALGELHSATQLTRTTGATTVTIGETPAEVLFSGGAPGQPGGLYQLNLRLPDTLTPGTYPITVRVGDRLSQQRPTITIR